MENALLATHKKWEKIHKEVDFRAIQDASTKPEPSSATPTQDPGSCAGIRLYGAIEELMRKEYRSGIAKHNTNSWADESEKEQFLAFCKDLTPEEMKMVQADELP